MYNTCMETGRKRKSLLFVILLCAVIALFVNLIFFTQRENKKVGFDEEALTRQAQEYYDKAREIYEQAIESEELSKQLELRDKAYKSCEMAIITIEIIMNHYEQINVKPPENARWNKLWYESVRLIMEIHVFVDYDFR